MTNAKTTNDTPEVVEDKIDAITHNGTGTVDVFFGDADATNHTIAFVKLESGIITATVEGHSGSAKSKKAALGAALELLYTVGFNFKANTKNAVYDEFVSVKRNAEPIKDDLTEVQLESMKEFDADINSGIAELGQAEKVTRGATRQIGSAIRAARNFLNASVAAEKDDPTAVASNKRWGQYTARFEAFKTSKNALAEFTAVGNMSDAMFSNIPAGKDSAKSIGAWVNERTGELARSCATIVAREKETMTSAKGFDLMVATLKEVAETPESADVNINALGTLANETLVAIDGLTLSEFEKTKFGKAMAKAMRQQAADRVTDEQKAEVATAKAVETVAASFGEMDIAQAAEHIATIMFAHDEYADIYETVLDVLKAKQTAADDAQLAADLAAEEEADADIEG